MILVQVLLKKIIPRPRLLKSVAPMINRPAAYQLAMVRYLFKTALIAEALLVINPRFKA